MSPPYYEPETVAPSATKVSEPETDKPAVYSKEVEEDKKQKTKILLDLIASKCNENSDFEDFRDVAQALKAGDQLQATVLTGGVTNYSYKVNLESGDGPAFFAKIAFPYALWNPDRSMYYDTARTVNEYKIMKRFSELMGDNAPVAKTLLCEDVNDMKILVCEWSSNDEQWANQFIEGAVDHRVIPKLAESLAILNLAPFDNEFGPDFNDNARPCMQSLYPLSSQLVAQCIGSDASIDSCVSYLKAIGQDKFDQMMATLAESYVTRECINHSDPHPFNILVEPKPNPDILESFGQHGDLVLCDWEMTMAGPNGRDVGIVQSFPIACAIHHALHGRKKVAHDLLSCCVEVWDAYAKVMVEQGGKDEAFLERAFRMSMGFNGFRSVTVFYLMDLVLMEDLPRDLSHEMMLKRKGSVGLVGLKLMEYGFANKEAGLTLDELRDRFRSIVEDEIEVCVGAASHSKPRPRRASTLRASGRRVSDASLPLEAARRLSAP